MNDDEFIGILVSREEWSLLNLEFEFSLTEKQLEERIWRICETDEMIEMNIHHIYEEVNVPDFKAGYPGARKEEHQLAQTILRFKRKEGIGSSNHNHNIERMRPKQVEERIRRAEEGGFDPALLF